MAEVTISEVRNDLLSRLNEARGRTDALFDIVRPDSLFDRPIPERHRIIFYLGHLEAFDRNLLDGRSLNAKSGNSAFDQLFAFGIDPVGGGLPTDQVSDWPSPGEVRAYNRQVRDTIDNGLERAEFSDEIRLLLNVAIEHRLMHAETLAYMFHRLPLDRKVALDSTSRARLEGNLEPQSVEVSPGKVTLGLQREASFGWDNEFDAHDVDVPGFMIDKYKVTNGDYLRFLMGGGYSERSLWSDEDWSWIQANDITRPAFWEQGNDGWTYRTMFEEIPLPLDWPVYVSHAEATAYARWASKVLPTEAQWQRAAAGAPQAGNFDFVSWDPVAVNAASQGESAWGVLGMSGNGWEWTSSAFEPFPGFQPFPFYPGYSANFFDRKHFVLKGGSARTAACMLRPTFRNWFQPHYPYVYAGFRCVSTQS